MRDDMNFHCLVSTQLTPMDNKRFPPAWWLPGAHLQTLWPFLFTPHCPLDLRRERIELPDGDFLDLDWMSPSDGPLVLILHGLEGSRDSAYIQRLFPLLQVAGLQGVVMHFRGCSGEPNRLARAYHAGDTQDVAYVVSHLLSIESERPIVAIGFSLGGNVLLKWMGETGDNNPLIAASAISVPFDLHASADRLECGLSRIYQAYLLKALRIAILRKLDLLESSLDITRDEIKKLRTLRSFDNRITAPLHGFSNVDDYYTRASSRPWLRRIVVPTLIIQASNDPFMQKSGIPERNELSSCIDFELTRSGGHVGFISGRVPGLPYPWFETRVIRWFLDKYEKSIRSI